jgi:hypothetical protein
VAAAGAEKVLAAAGATPAGKEAAIVLGLARAAMGDPDSAKKLLARGGPLGGDLLALLGGADVPALGPRKGPAAKGAAPAMARGLKAYAAGSAAEAVAELRAAYEAALAAGPAASDALAAASFNLAHALWLSGDLAGAGHHFRVYLHASKRFPADGDHVERIARALVLAPAGGGPYVRELWSRPGVQLAPALAAALPW